MKSRIFQSATVQVILFASFVLLSISALLVSCQKEVIVEVPVDVPCDTTATIIRPDTINDLIGWYNPLEHVFFVDPAYYEEALFQFGAVATPEGFAKEGITPDGKPIQLNFTVLAMNAPDIYVLSETLNTTTNPDLIQEFTKEGTSYKLYKNAKCGTGGPPLTSGCYGGDNGTSYHNVWYSNPWPRCERGTDFCVEVFSVVGRKVVFEGANCEGIIKSEAPYHDWRCQ